jgi:hypothetical protein
MAALAWIALGLIENALRWLMLLFRSKESVRAENLFLRHQLALYMERGVRPRQDRCSNPCQPGRAGSAVRLAWRPCRRVAGNHDSLASRRMEVAVVCEVATGPASGSRGTARADSQDSD